MRRTGFFFVCCALALGLMAAAPGLSMADLYLQETGMPTFTMWASSDGATGRLDGSVGVSGIVDGQTLSGTLFFDGALTAQPGSSISPGNAMASFTGAASDTITLAGSWGTISSASLVTGTLQTGSALIFDALGLRIVNLNFSGSLDPAFAKALDYSTTLSNTPSTLMLWSVGGLLLPSSGLTIATASAPTPAPLPASYLFFATGLLGLVGLRKRTGRNK